MSKKKLVIVESPTKAKTISRFLDSSYKVMACMGHIRDLPESAKDIPEKYKNKKWKNLGVNIEKNFEPIYCVPNSKSSIIKDLKKELKKSKELILATDEDREGESISWHLQFILQPKVPVKRIVFHEITKMAIESALKNYRSVDKGLVKAQEARRVLDRLVGYTLSPLLWKKITTGLSAGRVQSVAVKLISEREIERMNFIKSLFYGISAELSPKNSKENFLSILHSWKSKKLAISKDFNSKAQLINKKLLHLTEKDSKNLLKTLKKSKWLIKNIEKKPISRSPKPPFITSTLQQEAHSKLGLSPKNTMSVAQKLYEKGLITYMRTDSTHLSQEALRGIKKAVSDIYGKKELVSKTRIYKTKSKGAQEAHEAIRPAGQTFKKPETSGLTGVELKLYKLIWQRTLAVQMKNCEQEQTSLHIKAGEALFQTNGLRIVSPGFYRVYRDQEDNSKILPDLKKGQELKCLKVESKEKQTQAPARYNEASLIQKLEKEGIGRPSTYAPVISTIQDRGYVKKQGKNLAPTFTALAVTKLLSEHLPDYVNLNFTSKMEKALDDMAEGKVPYVKYLNSIYNGKKGLKEQVKQREKTIDSDKSRTLQFPSFKGINFNVGRFGAYITKKQGQKELKSSLPADTFLSDLTLEKLEEIVQIKTKKETAFGIEPKTKKKIFIKTGPFGPYLELEGGEKRTSIPKFLPLESLNLKQALKLLELPKILGLHPKTKKEIKKSIGRFGPYIVHEGDFRSAPRDESFLDLDLKSALKILAQEKRASKKNSSKKAIKEWTHNKQSIQILQGYSPYIKYKNKNYSLAKDTDIKKLDLKSVLQIIDKKADSSKKITKAKRKTTNKKTAKKQKTRTTKSRKK
ncbi:MAG: type I DNA topoisomerase [Bdellovibrionaceae bacterium]|nr:type I DNA topoisomerase [Pseudobdellovibrionaceae bacterium]